jgi:hypothetical protein
VIEEKKPELTVEGFIEAVQTVLSGLGQEDVPPFFVQQCKLQCLAQPTNVEHSLQLLAERVSNVYGPIEPFERPPTHFGVRFQFPPVILRSGESDETEASRITAEGPQASEQNGLTEPLAEGAHEKKLESFVTARFETYTEDVKQVWMEVSAAYPQLERPLMLSDTGRIVENIRETHLFLTDKCKRFLDQFDRETPPGSGDPNQENS